MGAVFKASTGQRRHLSSDRFDRGWFNQIGIRQTQQFPSNFRFNSRSGFLLSCVAPLPNGRDVHQDHPFVSLGLMLHTNSRSARKAGLTPAPDRYSTPAADHANSHRERKSNLTMGSRRTETGNAGGARKRNVARTVH